MPSVFVVFPPGAGGNHLKNIVVSCYQNVDMSLLYGNYKKPYMPTSDEIYNTTK